jgi:NAD-dependent DNA ligase
MKKFFPENCPECGTLLRVEEGKAVDVIKLVCPNKDCSGSKLKKLEKGIVGLEIKGLGPAVIKKLSLSGIENAYDLFNKELFNEKSLCATGEFKKGRALEKIMDAVNAVKEIPINKAILSLQLQDIGKTLSLQIGKYLSGVPYTFDGLNIRVRTDILNKNSQLYNTIVDSLKKFEDYGIIIFKKPKKSL